MPFLRTDLERIREKAMLMADLRDLAQACVHDTAFELLQLSWLWHNLELDDLEESLIPDKQVLQTWAVAHLLSEGMRLHIAYGDLDVQLA